MALPSLPIRDTGSPLALDARNLAALKQQAKAAPGESLRAAAGQFEALFMQMLLKSMRDALPQDGPFDSPPTPGSANGVGSRSPTRTPPQSQAGRAAMAEGRPRGRAQEAPTSGTWETGSTKSGGNSHPVRMGKAPPR